MNEAEKGLRTLTINSSGKFLRAKFEVFLKEGESVCVFEENEISLPKKLIRLTRLRILLPVSLNMTNFKTMENFTLERKTRFIGNPIWIMKRKFGEEIFSFTPYFKSLSKLSYKISGQFGNPLGEAEMTSLLIGSQTGEVNDLAGKIVSRFEWKKSSFFKRHDKCNLYIYADSEMWEIISITAAVIRGITLWEV